MNIMKILEKIRNIPDCIVYSPCGIPELNNKIELPDDLKLFYKNCGGISLLIGNMDLQL